jgi:hypothetical protein
MDGCYLINYTPANSTSFGYAGTLRVESTTGRVHASGDFYRRSFDFNAGALMPISDPKGGVPTFPIADYRYYLDVTAIVHLQECLLHCIVAVDEPVCHRSPICAAAFGADLTGTALHERRVTGLDLLFGLAAIAVLADWVRRGTEQVAEYAGGTIGSLLNVSFGNAAELVLALFVLAQAQTQVVQAQITGSIIGTTLLFLGISALAGGRTGMKASCSLGSMCYSRSRTSSRMKARACPPACERRQSPPAAHPPASCSWRRGVRLWQKPS